MIILEEFCSFNIILKATSISSHATSLSLFELWLRCVVCLKCPLAVASLIISMLLRSSGVQTSPQATQEASSKIVNSSSIFLPAQHWQGNKCQLFHFQHPSETAVTVLKDSWGAWSAPQLRKLFLRGSHQITLRLDQCPCEPGGRTAAV
jgi:hypothetical protein